MKKRLAILVAALAVVAFAGTAFAGAVDVTVGAPYIQKALCDQVGNITLEFDGGTTFDVGDQIKVGLVGTPTFCKAVDMLVAAGGTGGTSKDASGFTNKVALTTDNSAPLRCTLGVGVLTHTGEGVAFRVKAAEGSDTLTITVVADSNGDGTFGGTLDTTGSTTFVATSSPDNELQLVLFNEVTYAAPANTTSAIFKTGLNPLTMIEKTDNTLCANTGASFASDYVGVGISAEDKVGAKLWDFNPASPNIAIVKAGQSFTLYDCAKSEPGTILLCSSSSADQEASEAAALIVNENGTGAPGGVEGTNTGAASDANGYSDVSADAYKNVTHRNNNLVFQTSNGSAFENGDYKLELEIKVAPVNSSDAVSGDYGVYWNSTAIKAGGFEKAASVDFADKATSACATSDAEGTALAGVTTKAYDADAKEITSFKTDTANDCKFDAAASKAVTLKVAAGNIKTAYSVDYDTDGYMYINLPDMVYDATKLTAGKNVYVEAKLIKMPCELVGTGKLLIGTASTVSNTGTASSVTYPYFAEVAANGKTSEFFNGFTIANTSTSATAEGTATLTIYEADGDSFNATVKVMPGAVQAFLLSGLTATETTASKANTTGDHVFGGQRCWVKVSADFVPYGSAMITNKTQGGVMSYVVGNNTNDK